MLSEATMVKLVYTLVGVLIVIVKLVHTMWLQLRDLKKNSFTPEQLDLKIKLHTQDMYDDVTEFKTDFKQFQKDDTTFKVSLSRTLGKIEANIG